MPSAHKPLKKYCTTREAAEILGISLKTAQLWSENGLLEAWRTEGGHRRIYRDSVERLLFHGQSEIRPREPSVEAAGQGTFRILLVEENEALRDLHAQRLRNGRVKPEVSVAAGGMEALLALGGKAPDLLITDVQLSDLDGFHMVRVLRARPGFSRMAIAVVTDVSTTVMQARGDLPADVRIIAKSLPFAEIERYTEEVAMATGRVSRPPPPR